MPDALLRQGSGALTWRATDLARVTREALGHHMEACFKACFPQEGVRQGGPDPQEFVSKAIQELQESRVMKGGHRLPAVAPHPGEDGGPHICINVPGLNRVTSVERLWPSRVGRCEGPPHSYVHMPYGLLSMAAAYQRLMRGIMEAQEDRRSAALAEMEVIRKELPAPPEPPQAPGPGVS